MHFHVWVGQYISITEGKMILAALAQFAVCFLILAWVLKKKTGEPYSRKAVIRFVLFGALGVILFFCLTLVLPIQEDTFYGMNPIISGFLTADRGDHAQKYLDSTPIIRGINGTELVDLILKYYEDLSEKYRKMIPLKMVYIPVPKEE